MKNLLKIAVVIGIASVANAAFGAANSGTLTVTATIADECMVGTSGLAFGAYSFVNANAAVNGAGTIKVTCTSGSVPKVALGASANEASGQRSMASGANLLSYNLFSDASRLVAWDSATAPITYASATGDGTTEKSIDVYGTIPAGQNKPSGSYSDPVPVSVTF